MTNRGRFGCGFLRDRNFHSRRVGGRKALLGWFLRKIWERGEGSFIERVTFGEIIGVEKLKFLLLVERIRGRALGRAWKPYGRKVELTQFSLSRLQTLCDLIIFGPEELVAEHGVYLDHASSD
jgi:hypothetical protein